MNCLALVEAMATRGLRSSLGGAKPHATLYSAIIRAIATKGDQSRFVKIRQKLLDLSFSLITPHRGELIDNLSAKNALALIEEANDFQRNSELTGGEATSPAVTFESLGVGMILCNGPKVCGKRLRSSKLPSILCGARQV